MPRTYEQNKEIKSKRKEALLSSLRRSHDSRFPAQAWHSRRYERQMRKIPCLACAWV